MALKIIDAKKSGFPHDGRFGCVHLIFDRDIDADPLRLSIFKLLGREYLGRSTPPKANWTPARSHFFDAPVVLRGAGQTVFSLGPEVTTFIPDESMLEIASEDNLIRETAVWSGVSVDFTWPGPPPEPVRAEPKPPQPQPPKAPTPPPQPPVPQPPVEPVVVAPPPEEVKVVEPPPPPEPPPQTAVPPAPPAKRGLRAAMLALGVLVAGGIGAVYWGTQHRDYLCDHFHLFCDPEVVAYHQAKDCAAPKACGVTEACLTNYRNTYPNGRFSAELDDIAVKKGRPCVGDTPVPPATDQEKVAYDHVVTCTASVTCGASACAADYRQSFPNGAHKADVDWIVSQKDAACRAEAAEKEVYDQAVGCARTRTCGALDCIADYRRSYPNGRYKAQIDQLAQQQNAAQCVDREKAEFDEANACARTKSCGALDCLAPYRRDYPGGRFKAQIDQLAQQPNAVVCPNLDREAYDRAERCSQPLQCGANHCLIEYRRDFPNGSYRSLIEQIGATKGADCPVRPTLSQDTTPNITSSPLPPFVPIQPGDEPGIRNCSARNLEPIAQMICKDSDMARANGELQKAFEARLKSTSDTSGLRSSERAWIEQRDRDCAIPPSGSWEINDLRKVKNCFLDKTRARTDELR